jgi:hypothetical protein
MTQRNVVLLNKDNVVVALFPFDDTDLVDAGTFFGLLSNPSFIEVDLNSEVRMGWKYINGRAVKN